MTDPNAAAPSNDRLTETLQAFEKRTDAVDGLAVEVTSLLREVRTLRRAVQHRPSRRWVDRKRRLTAVSIAIYTVLLVMAHDQHVEVCGPGARSETLLDAFVAGETDPATLRGLGNPAVPWTCDALFPLHAHEAESWPTPASYIGLGGYLAAGGLAFYWAVGGTRSTKRVERAIEGDSADDIPLRSTLD